MQFIRVNKCSWNGYSPMVPFGKSACASVSGLARINGKGTIRRLLNTCRSFVSSISSTSYLFCVWLYVTISAKIQLSSSSKPLTRAATISPGFAMYELSAAMAPHKGGAFSPGLLTNNGSVWADICNIFINAPRRIVSLLPAFRAYDVKRFMPVNFNVFGFFQISFIPEFFVHCVCFEFRRFCSVHFVEHSPLVWHHSDKFYKSTSICVELNWSVRLHGICPSNDSYYSGYSHFGGVHCQYYELILE